MKITTRCHRIRHLPILVCILISLAAASRADIITDGSVGPAETLGGPDYHIPEGLGTMTGQNLFHSFQTFSVFKGESATFTGPDSVENVFSRVTGGDVSAVDGLLRSEMGQADFYLINPSGVVFGPDAKVDVPAAFHVSTAHELRFSDGKAFSAVNPDASSLSLADPESFGYLSP